MHLQRTAAFLCLLLCFGFTSSALSQQLQRRAMLGIAFENAQAQDLHSSGVHVLEVVPGTSAASIGIAVGDIITDINGESISEISDVQIHVAGARAGQDLVVGLIRNGTSMELRGQFLARPTEQFDNAVVELGEFSTEDGTGRLITVTPDPNKKLPVVFFIPGFTCMTVDGLQDWHPYRKFFEDVVAAGFVLVRAEKPGMGDSEFAVPCSDCTYEQEVASFRAAFAQMLESPHIDKDNVFIFGHSLGGIQAPVLGAEFQPAGIAVYGTTHVPWLEYLLRVNRFQHEGFGIDPLRIEQEAKAAYPALTKILVFGESPSDVADESDAYANFLRSFFQWESGDLLYGRSHLFWKGIQDQMTLQHWTEYEGNVLSLYGGADVHTVDSRDQEDLADLINRYNPGSAEFIDLETIDHNFVETGGLDQTYEVLSSGSYESDYFTQKYSKAVAETFVQWMRKVINT